MIYTIKVSYQPAVWDKHNWAKCIESVQHCQCTFLLILNPELLGYVEGFFLPSNKHEGYHHNALWEMKDLLLEETCLSCGLLVLLFNFFLSKVWIIIDMSVCHIFFQLFLVGVATGDQPPSLSRASPSVTLLCMSSLTTSIYLLYDLALFIFPGNGYIAQNSLSIPIPLCPKHLSLASLSLSPTCFHFLSASPGCCLFSLQITASPVNIHSLGLRKSWDGLDYYGPEWLLWMTLGLSEAVIWYQV